MPKPGEQKTVQARILEYAGDVGWTVVSRDDAMRNKWASCSTNGHLNLSTDLLDLRRDLWDYVIVHELLHFFVPNHGKLWKSLMRAHLGDYQKLETELTEVGKHSD